MFRFVPDTNVLWTKELRGVYVRHDGLAKIEKQGNVWVPYYRANLDTEWQAEKMNSGSVICYGALHAAQDHFRRGSK